MSRNDEPKNPGAEKDAVPGLDRLYSGRTMPEALEEQVVGSLMDGGWLRGDSDPGPKSGNALRFGWGAWAIRAAAGLLLFAAGWLAASAQGQQPVVQGGQYMLLLWEDASFDAGAPPSQVAEEYARWAGDAARRGIPIAGNELALADRVVIPDARQSEPGVVGALSGYFIIEADDPAEARVLAQEHPHVRYGGWIEVAPVVQR